MTKKERKATICVLSIVFFVPFVIGVAIGAMAFPKTTTTVYVPEYVPEYRYIYTEEQQPKIEYESLGVFEITAYCPCEKCCGKSDGITATGTKATEGRTIAADPSVLQYGAKVIINGNEYTVEDCGGAIKGNRIDMYFDSHEDALQWGRQTHEVFASK